MKRIFLSITLLTLGSTMMQAQCTDLFFSEYLEGSSNNKAVEIYNPTLSSVNLTDYVIYRFNNGSPVAQDSLFPQGVLSSHGVYVAGNPSAVASILAVSDTTHTITFFNGDDVLLLKNRITGDTLDIIGIVGVDPGTNWVVGTGATSEFTLVRADTVHEGTANWALSSTQWVVYPQNTDTALGVHYMIPCALPPGPVVNLGTDVWMCGGYTMMLDAGNPGCSYLWSTGDTTQVISVIAPDTVWVIATDIYAQADTDTIILGVYPNPSAAFSSSTAGLTVNFTDLSSLAMSWIWDFGDGATAMVSSPSHTYAAPGTYMVCLTVTSADGCSDSVCHPVTVSSSTAMDIGSGSGYTVYPNPVSSDATLFVTTPGFWRMLDLNGREVMPMMSMNSGNNLISFQTLVSGMYILEIHQEGKVFRQRISRQ